MLRGDFPLFFYGKSSAARTRSRWAEFPLYHTTRKKSIGKMHKITVDKNPVLGKNAQNTYNKN